MSEQASIQITPTDNGPYYIKGPISFVDADGKVIATEEELWLCRCGQSGNKPMCDGSHRRTGFESLVRATQ